VTWQSRPLGEIADLQAGVGFPPSLQGRLEGELPLAKVGDISRAVRAGGKGFISPLNHITRSEAAALRARIFPPGSTVFAKIGEAISQNFRLFTDREAAVDNNVMGAIPRNGVEPRYLFRFLQTVDLYAYSSKTTVPSVRKSDLEQIAVPLPPLAEQRRIADILDKADAIRRKRKEAIALTEELLRSAFLEMFGDPVTNPKGWPVKPLGGVAEVAGGLQVTSARASNPISLPYLRVANVYRDRLDLSVIKEIRVTEAERSRATLRDGDILVVEGHGNPEDLGRAAVWRNEIAGCTHQNHLIRVRSDRSTVDPTFLSAFLNSSSGRKQMLKLGKTTSGLNTISTNNVRSVQVVLPPLNHQAAYASVASRVGELASKMQCRLAEDEGLFAGLVARAFSGSLEAQC
jgi:type I restriction enzyme, S subunit